CCTTVAATCSSLRRRRSTASRKGRRGANMQRRLQFQFWYVVVAVLAVVWLRDLWVLSQRVEEITYSQFEQALRDGRVASVEISGTMRRGEYRDRTPDGAARFVTPRVDTELVRELAQYDVEFKGVADNTLLREVLSWVLPAPGFF